MAIITFTSLKVATKQFKMWSAEQFFFFFFLTVLGFELRASQLLGRPSIT
jgi:hypothetical protein